MKKLRLDVRAGQFKHKYRSFGSEIELIFRSNKPEKYKIVGYDPCVRRRCWRVSHGGQMKWFVTVNKILIRDLLEYVVPMEITTIKAVRFSSRSTVWYMGSVNGHTPRSLWGTT